MLVITVISQWDFVWWVGSVLLTVSGTAIVAAIDACSCL